MSPTARMVLSYGRVSAILEGAAMTEENILRATLSQKADA